MQAPSISLDPQHQPSVKPTPKLIPPLSPAATSPTLCKRIMTIASTLLLILAALALSLYSPLVFLTSFTVGIIYPKAAYEAIYKIKQVWQAKTLLMVATCVGYTLLGLPAVLLIATALSGLHQGSQLYQWSTKTTFRT